MNTGWICPKCQRVYAPSVTECVACNAHVQVQNWPLPPSPTTWTPAPVPYFTTTLTQNWPFQTSSAGRA